MCPLWKKCILVSVHWKLKTYSYLSILGLLIEKWCFHTNLFMLSDNDIHLKIWRTATTANHIHCIQQSGQLFDQALTCFCLYKMDSEILWEILKFPNFEYYPAGCAILEYGTALWVWPSQFETGTAIFMMALFLYIWWYFSPIGSKFSWEATYQLKRPFFGPSGKSLICVYISATFWCLTKHWPRL